MINMMTLSDSDKVEKALQSYNLLSIIVVAVIAGVIIALICTLAVAAKKSRRPVRSRRSLDNYKKTQGRITKVEEETYFVKPYVHKPQLMTDDFNKNKKKVFSAVENQIAEDAVREMSKPIEKKRYKVNYTFAVENLGDGFCGECLVYEKTDSIEKGKPIDVLYDPEHPQINYTEHSRPV